MFWSSVGQGLAALAHWEVCLGILLLAAGHLIFAVFASVVILTAPSETEAKGAVGLLLLGNPVVQAAGITAFIVLLLPTLLGGDGMSSLGQIIALFPIAMKYGILSLLLILILCFVPRISRLITGAPGLSMIIQGSLVFRPIARGAMNATLENGRVPDGVFPSIFFCAGYIIVGIAIAFAAMIAATVADDWIQRKRDPLRHLLERNYLRSTGKQVIISYLGSAMVGTIPILMYGQHVAIAVQTFAAAEGA